MFAPRSMTPRRQRAANGRSGSTSRSSAGTGSSRPRRTMRTSAPATARLVGRTFVCNVLLFHIFSLGTVVESPHASIVQMSGPRLHSSAGPCCAPRKMSPIYMLYLDADKNVIKGKLPNMKVQRCGCS